MRFYFSLLVKFIEFIDACTYLINAHEYEKRLMICSLNMF